MTSVDHLVTQATAAGPMARRRQAFLSLIRSEGWRQAFFPEVLERQGYLGEDGHVPDMATMKALLPLLARDEEKQQHLLEVLGAPMTVELLHLVLGHEGTEMAELVLAHLRTATDERAMTLLHALRCGDPAWVTLPGARRVIRRWLTRESFGRDLVMEGLARAGKVEAFLIELRDNPPRVAEEWRALGRSHVADPVLIDLALASFRYSPDALGYLLELDPVPPTVAPRMMASARPLWLIDALELCLFEKLKHPLILPLAELGIRLGGKPMSMAGAWLGATRISIELLSCLSRQINRDGQGTDQLSNLLWVRRNAPSADRALEDGRRGLAPDPMDAAALVRQLRGDEVARLVREILATPFPGMMEPLLRPLCGVYLNAVMEVTALSESDDPDLAERAKAVMEWRDVEWE